MRLAAGIAIVLVARMFAVLLVPLCSEDAYITFHAAIDPAWRAATTSPVWAMLVGLGHDPPAIARWLSISADVLAVYSAHRLLGRYGFWGFLGLWLTPFFTGSALSGLETHAVACLMLFSRVHPLGYALAAMLRPDAAVIALASSGKRWAWALGGAVVLLLAGLLYSGHAIPQTIGSKLLTYGLHFGNWNWLFPNGFGWMTLALLPAFLSRRARRHVLVAAGFIVCHALMGTVYFWWYAVPPLAMLGMGACEALD
jgi:hypothetical protein